MNCPRCGSTAYRRADGHSQRPVIRSGIIFRQHVCQGEGCGHRFMSAQLVVTDEFTPVERLATVLKELMDESDARASAEIEGAESLEAADGAA